MQPNHLTAIIGAAMLIVAGVGLFSIEEKPATTNTGVLKYHVSFPISVGGSGTTVSVNDGATVEAMITLDQPNMTFVGLVVTWTDHAPRFTSASTVSVQLNDPNGTQVGAGTGTDGAKGYGIIGGPQASPPADYDIKARSESQAWQKVLDANPPMVNGTGGWKMKVSVTRGGFHPLRSGSADVTLDIVCNYYQADVKLVEASK
jgi:hypothetical protein